LILRPTTPLSEATSVVHTKSVPFIEDLYFSLTPDAFSYPMTCCSCAMANATDIFPDQWFCMSFIVRT